MKMWEILVPNEMPAATAFTELCECKYTGLPINKIKLSYHNEWDKYVREKCGGLTITRSVKGEWVSGTNMLFRERMIPVKLVCDYKTINEIASFTKAYYEQEKVLFYKVSDEVFFI